MSKKSSTFRLQVIGGEKLQGLYQKLREGHPVELVRERQDRVAVYAKVKKFIGSKREYLGYLYRSEDIAYQIATGYKIFDTQVAGFYPDDERGHGYKLIIQVTVERTETPDEKYDQRQDQIQQILDRSRKLEKTNPEEAIIGYYKVVDEIKKLDADLEQDKNVKEYCEREEIASIRWVRYPVNRLSLLLEKSQRYDDSLAVIDEYESLDYEVPLSKSEGESVAKRKIRLQKKVLQ
jgi:hypothetical protein